MDNDHREKLEKELLDSDENQTKSELFNFEMAIELQKNVKEYLNFTYKDDPRKIKYKELMDEKKRLNDLTSIIVNFCPIKRRYILINVVKEAVGNAWNNLNAILKDFRIDNTDNIAGIESLVKVINSEQRIGAPQLPNEEKSINIHYPNKSE